MPCEHDKCAGMLALLRAIASHNWYHPTFEKVRQLLMEIEPHVPTKNIDRESR